MPRKSPNYRVQRAIGNLAPAVAAWQRNYSRLHDGIPEPVFEAHGAYVLDLARAVVAGEIYPLDAAHKARTWAPA